MSVQLRALLARLPIRTTAVTFCVVQQRRFEASEIRLMQSDKLLRLTCTLVGPVNKRLAFSLCVARHASCHTVRLGRSMHAHAQGHGLERSIHCPSQLISGGSLGHRGFFHGRGLRSPSHAHLPAGCPRLHLVAASTRRAPFGSLPPRQEENVPSVRF